jgi:hypothetical protein
VAACDVERVYPQRRLFPGLGGGVAVLAGEGQSHIVRANVTGVTIGELGTQPPLAMAVQAYGHGTDDLTRDGVEAVAYLSVAIAAQYPTF